LLFVKNGNPRRKDSGKDMATIRSWFPNFTIVDKVEGTVLIEPDELLGRLE